MAGREQWRVALGVVLAVAVAGGCADRDDALARRRAEVADRGEQIMPFDLDATTHTFTPTVTGGVQTVVADDPDDAAQIALIRDHLAEERDRFARGDFEDPAAIHGHDMDGVAELRAGHARITVAYSDRPDGARLTYTSDDPALIDALHAWFDRQVIDHGAHARTG